MGYPVTDGVRMSVPYTIPAGATGLGPAVDLGGYRLAGIILPAGWLTGGITFQGQDPTSGTFFDITDDGAAEVAVASIAASKALVFTAADLSAMSVFRYIKIRSGTAGSPVNQTGAPTLTLILVPLA